MENFIFNILTQKKMRIVKKTNRDPLKRVLRDSKKNHLFKIADQLIVAKFQLNLS